MVKLDLFNPQYTLQSTKSHTNNQPSESCYFAVGLISEDVAIFENCEEIMRLKVEGVPSSIALNSSTNELIVSFTNGQFGTYQIESSEQNTEYNSLSTKLYSWKDMQKVPFDVPKMGREYSELVEYERSNAKDMFKNYRFQLEQLASLKSNSNLIRRSQDQNLTDYQVSSINCKIEVLGLGPQFRLYVYLTSENHNFASESLFVNILSNGDCIANPPLQKVKLLIPNETYLLQFTITVTEEYKRKGAQVLLKLLEKLTFGTSDNTFSSIENEDESRLIVISESIVNLPASE
ncbi:hypothetical protein HK098_000489 [Nowakowskiella sp. JEL0407]|nr:hypothetical protein HK098_000489 [Nowakowskiella sp. JEL0407]